jgi:hypothetical protein
MGKTCLSRISGDLENIFILDRPLYKTPGRDDPPDLYRIQGSVDNLGGTKIAKLRCASRAHVPLGKSRPEGIAEIVYYVQAGPGGNLRLKRADNLYPYPRFEERSTDPVLCEMSKRWHLNISMGRKTFDHWDWNRQFQPCHSGERRGLDRRRKRHSGSDRWRCRACAGTKDPCRPATVPCAIDVG